jgi:SnoaL-like protein
MDDDARRGVIRRLWDSVGKEDLHDELYADDAVLDFPQSGERFEGVENFRAWRSEYPGTVELTLEELRGTGDLWVGEGTISYDGGPAHPALGIYELRGDRISRETLYIAESWQAPDWRARWRSAP